MLWSIRCQASWVACNPHRVVEFSRSAMNDQNSYSELLVRVRADRSNLFAEGTPASGIAELQAYVKGLGMSLPEDYILFLKEFDGGEFLFGRMHCITANGAGFFYFSEELEQFYENAPAARTAKYLPFADDYGGNFYCFDTKAFNGDRCPVVLWVHELEEDQEPETIADSFEEFIEDAYNEETGNAVDVYIASNAQLAEVKPTDGKAALTVAATYNVFPYVRQNVRGTNIFSVTSGNSWWGYNSDQLAEGAETMNSPGLKRLSQFLQAMLDETEEPLELYATSPGEQSRDSRYKRILGNLRIGESVVELTAGDHIQINPDGSFEEVPPHQLPRCGQVKAR